MAWISVGAAAVAAVGLTGLAIFGTIGSVHAQSIPSYSARSGLPSFHLVQPTSTISPSDALTVYGSPVAAPHVGATPRIEALARALEHNPDRIYQFVRNTISFEPQFGLHKGGDGVLLDGSGGAFDQAQLMVQLARASGYSARYRLGTVTLGAEAASILKVSDARQACLLLAAGGTPALVNGSTSCSTLSGAVSSVQMLHIWPEINIGGAWYAFDPALKTNIHVTGIDLWAAAGTNAGSAWGNVSSGVSSGQTSVTGLNGSSIAGKMATYATNLQNTLIASHSNKSIHEVTGGWDLNRDYSTPRNTSLPNASAIATWDGDIPTPYRATVKFYTGGFQNTLDLPSIYAYRIQGLQKGHQFILAIRKCDHLNASPKAYFGGQSFATPTACETANTIVGGVDDTYFAAWDRKLYITIDHPYAAQGGAYADEEALKYIEVGKPADIVIRTAGGMGVRRAMHSAAIDPLMDLKVVAEGSPYECVAYGGPGPNQQIEYGDNCASGTGAEDWNYWIQDNAKFAKGTVVAAEMKSHKDNVVNLWTELFDATTGITEGLSGARIFHQHSIGVSLNPSYAGTVLDIDTAVGIAPAGSDQPHYILSALASLASASEAGALGQIRSDEDGGATTAINGGRVLASGAGLTRLNPGQTSASLPTGVGAAVRTQVDLYLAQGFSVIVPEQTEGGFFARRSEGSELAWIVGNGVKGTPTANNVDPRNDFRKGATDAPRPLDFLGSAEKSNIASNVAGTQIGAVDLRSGSLSLSEGDEITMGQGDFPYSLGFNRRYASSGPASSFGELGAGWTHNWESSAYRRSDVTALVNGADVVSVAPTLISAMIALEAGRANTIEASLLSGVALIWWQDEGVNNVVQLNGGGRSARFVRLANGGWRNASSPTEEIVLGGPTPSYPSVFDWKLADKSVIHFERFSTAASSPWANDIEARSHGRVGMTSWTFPTGIVINLAYSSATPTNPPYLQAVSNNLGASLSFTYTVNPTQQATTACMNAAATSGNPIDEKKACAVAAQSGGRLVGVSNGPNSVGFGYLDDCHLNTSYCAYYLIVSTQTGRRNRYYAYDAPSGAAAPYLFGYQQVLQTITDDGIATPRARYVWSALAGEYAPRVIESYDAYNRKTTFFSTNSIFSAAEDALGNRSRQTYDEDGRLIAVADPLDRTSRQTWYGSGRSRQVQSAWGDRKAFEYDSKGNLTKVTRSPKDGCGTDGWWCQTIVVTAEYDSYWNKPTKITLPATIDGQAANDWLMTYNAQGLTATQTGPSVYDGKNGGYANPVWRTWYDAYGRINRTQDPTGIETAMIYGGNSQPAFCLTQSRQSSQSGSQWGAGLNQGTNFTCNSVGDVLTVQDPRGYVTTAWYDALRRKIQLQPAVGGLDQWTYDLDGNPIEEKHWDVAADTWRTTTTSFSLTGKALTVTDPSGDVSRTCYDALDRPIATIDPTGRAKKTVYNAAGQTTEIHRYLTGSTADTACNLSVSFPSGVTNILERRFEYNSAGMQSAEVDANSNYTSLTYDGLGRMIITHYANGQETHRLTNQRDQLVNFKNRDNTRRAFFFDVLGRNTQIYEHEDGANWPNGRQSRTNFDLAGRPMYKDVSSQANGVWDDNLNRDQRWYAYTAAGALQSECWRPRSGAMGENYLCIDYQYDAAGNRTKIAWPGWTRVADYTYDAENRVTAVNFGNSVAIQYDTLGRRTRLTRSNGALSDYAYEADGDLASITQHFTASTGQPQLHMTYVHDAAGRITQIDYSRPDFEWQPSEAYARSYGVPTNMNQMTSEAGNSFGWNANGNMTLDQRNTVYTWTFGNRLIGASRPGMTATYAYDSEDRRTMKIVDGVMTRTLWSGTEPIGQYDTNGNLIRWFVPDGTGAMDGRLASIEANGEIRWIHTDHQGSTIATTDNAGVIQAKVRYSPFGETAPTGGSTSDIGGTFGYTGREFDPETGNYQYRARYYMPSTGMFLSTDPIGSKDDPNLYMYVGGDGVNRTDPTGRCFWDVCAVEGAVLVATTGAVIGCVATNCLQPVADAVVDLGGRFMDWLRGPVYNAPIVETTEPVVAPDEATPSDRPAGADGKTGSAGGPGAGKRFPAETPEVRAGKEGVPCGYCGDPTTNEPGNPNSRERDHIDPRSRGGNNTPENERDSCRTCNRGKGARNPDEWTPIAMTDEEVGTIFVSFPIGESEKLFFENIHAIKIGERQAMLDNSPFYAYGVSLGDIVDYQLHEDGRLEFLEVVKSGGHSCYRVRVPGGSNEFLKRWPNIERHGCSYEGASSSGAYYLASIDVPPSAKIDEVYSLLEAGLRDEIWDFEEANFARTPDAGESKSDA